MIQKSPQAVCLRDFSMTHYCVINYLFVTFRRSVSKFGRPYGRLFVLPGFPSVRVPSLGVYLLFALSSLRERLSCSLRLPPLPLHGYPCGLLPPYPAPSIPLTLLLHATNGKTACTTIDLRQAYSIVIKIQISCIYILSFRGPVHSV